MWLVDLLKGGHTVPKTIIYSRTITEVKELYFLFAEELQHQDGGIRKSGYVMFQHYGSYIIGNYFSIAVIFDGEC